MSCKSKNCWYTYEWQGIMKKTCIYKIITNSTNQIALMLLKIYLQHMLKIHLVMHINATLYFIVVQWWAHGGYIHALCVSVLVGLGFLCVYMYVCLCMWRAFVKCTRTFSTGLLCKFGWVNEWVCFNFFCFLSLCSTIIFFSTHSLYSSLWLCTL